MRRSILIVLTVIAPAAALLAAEKSTADERIKSVEISPDLLDEAGTLTFWFTPEDLLLHDHYKHHVLRSEALDFWIDVRQGNVLFLLHINKAMNGAPPEGGEPKLFWMAAEFTHFKRGQRYQAAWTWDCRDGTRNAFYLNGILQVAGVGYRYPGQVKPAEYLVKMHVVSDRIRIEDFEVHEEVLSEGDLRRRFLKSGAEDYTDEGFRDAGQKYVPKDVKWDTPVYVTSFDDPRERTDWKLEGGDRFEIDQGHLVLWNAPRKAPTEPAATDDPEQPADPCELDMTRASHLVCWLKREIPANFLMEFTICPRDPMDGMGIVFFSARGIHGESIFDPALKERDGAFSQYIKGDINNYHVSYWAGGRGSANMRKNAGFQLVAIGRDLVADAAPGQYKTVRIHKREGHIRVIVNDRISVEFDDTGERFGRPWTYSGWIGFRHMTHAGYVKYGHLKIWPLTDEASGK